MLPTVLEPKMEKVMTSPYVESTGHGPAAGHWTSDGLSRLRERLGAFLAECATWANIGATRFTLDDMNEAQLEDIGMRCTWRRVRWMDCREAAFGIDFEYRSVAGDVRSEGGLRT